MLNFESPLKLIINYSWGHTNQQQNRPNHLQVVQLTTITNADCRNRLAVRGEEGFVFDHKICTFTRVRPIKVLITGQLDKIFYFKHRLVKEVVQGIQAVRLSLVETIKLAFYHGVLRLAALVSLMVTIRFLLTLIYFIDFFSKASIALLTSELGF